MSISCKKTAELIEKRTYFKLTLWEKWQLKMHTAMCDVCKKWDKQSQQMDEAFKLQITHSKLGEKGSKEQLSESVKKEIITKLNKHGD